MNSSRVAVALSVLLRLSFHAGLVLYLVFSIETSPFLSASAAITIQPAVIGNP